MHDLIIEDARIVDGTGGPSRHGSVAVKDGRIVDVAGAAGQLARERLRAGGRVVAPCRPEAREVLMGDLVNVEAIPLEVMRNGIDWTWGNIRRLMWANDFPHSDSTWPNSQEILAKHAAHLTPEERDLVLHDNVAELYGLDVASP